MRGATLWKASTATLVSAILALGAASPASAGKLRITDPKGDAKPSLDIRAVHVQHSKKMLKTRVRIRKLNKRSRGAVTVLFNAKRRTRGSDFAIRTKVHTRKVTFFRTRPNGRFKRRIECPARVVTNLTFNRVAFNIPRSCLQRPGKVRVSVRTHAKGRNDSAPNGRGWTRLVKRG